MSYEERKAILGRDEIPNFQGFEYYVGGVFEVRAGGEATASQEGSAFEYFRLADEARCQRSRFTLFRW